jgi:hypothetical protein
MTMGGEKVVVLNEALASEWGKVPVGPQFSFEDSEVAWIGQAFTEAGKREAGLMD